MNYFIVSAFGKDEPGIVSHLTGIITSKGGNIMESQMQKLGTDFTTMILISVSKNCADSLNKALNEIPELQISINSTSPFKLDSKIPQCKIFLSGADNEGLVHKVAESLAEKKINIEEIKTETENAPVSGTVLFSMSARVSHPHLDINRLKNDMMRLGEILNVEIIVK